MDLKENILQIFKLTNDLHFEHIYIYLAYVFAVVVLKPMLQQIIDQDKTIFYFVLLQKLRGVGSEGFYAYRYWLKRAWRRAGGVHTSPL